MKLNLRAIIIFLVLFAVLAILPIIPIQTAPVIPNPVYQLSFVTLAGVIWRYAAPLVGVSYRWGWYTGAVILLIPLISLLAGLLFSRQRGSRS